MRGESYRWSGWLVFIVGSLLAFPFAMNLALGNSLGRDEHQHLAAGIALLREGWLPYRDYAFFHLPYLPWSYGALFSFGGDPLLISRVFSALCVALTAGLVAVAAWGVWREHQGKALIAAGAGIAILFTVPLFTQVAGHTWNLEPSTLFLLAAFVALLEKGKAGRWALAGVLTGVAAGYRITILPMVLPLMIMAWAQERSWRAVFIYSLGLSAGMLPIAVAFLFNPAEFFFGNVEFPKVNIDYRYATGEPRTMTLPTKLRFVIKEVMRPNWPLLIAFPATLLLARVWLKVRFWKQPVLRWGIISFPFLMFGALAPSPSFDQYYYPLIPFMVIGMVAMAKVLPEGKAGRALLAGLALMFVGFAPFCLDEYESFARLADRSKWAVTEAQEEAAQLRSRVGPQARVLTVAPGLALEAGLEVYREFMTGPFAWRVAPFVEEERHDRLRLLSPQTLELMLATAPPDAILTGYAKKEEKPLVTYARRHGFRKEKFADGKSLWLPPPAPPGR